MTIKRQNITWAGILVCLCYNLHAQNHLYDSLSNDINKVSDVQNKIDTSLKHIWHYARIDPEVSISLLSDLEAIYAKNDTDFKYEVMLYYYGVIYKNLGKYSLSEKFLIQYEALVEGTAKIASVNLVLSNLYREQSDWVQVIDRAEKALSRFIELDDTINQITSLMNIGYSLSQVDRVEDGIKYHYSALLLANKVNNSLQISIGQSNLGLSYQKIGRLDSAELHLLAAHRISELNEDVWGLAEDKKNLAHLYLIKERFEKALDFALAGHEYALKVKDPNLISDNKIVIGNAYIGQNRYKKGIKWLNEVLNNPNLFGSPNNKIGANEGLYIAYKNQRLFEKALKHKEIADQLNKEYNSIEVNAKVKGLEMRYQTAQKEKEIVMLNIQNKHATDRMQSFRWQLGGLTIFSVIILGLLFGLYRLYRISKQQQKAINKNLEEKNILLKEIHHRVKNNLQVISSILNLQGKHVDDPKAKSVLKEGQNRVKSMAMIHQRLYQNDNLLGVGVKEYFEKLILNLFNTYKVDKDKIKLNLNIEDLQLDVDTLIPLGLIVNELISNALKHAFVSQPDGMINVTLLEKEGTLFLNVQDNGIGSDRLQNINTTGSFGYRLIRTFSNQLDAKIDIESHKGTTVNLQIHDFKKVG